mgnify:CR=1 FL=1
MQKWIRIVLITIAALAILIVGALYFLNEDVPQKEVKGDADLLAERMMSAVNVEAWDSLKLISWTFPGEHHYLWDKERHFVDHKWGDRRVLLHTKTLKGIAYVNGQRLQDSLKIRKNVEKAWSHFCNDSWWLNAPVKAMDPGVNRSIVEAENGSRALKLEYSSGGVTPGDIYVWLLDDNYMPKSYKMWVSIIPVGGLEFTWEDWIELPGGALIATKHQSKGLTLELTNIKGAYDYQALNLEDPFSELDQIIQ